MAKITQEQLRAFYTVKQQIKAAEEQKSALRQAILDLHGLKAEIEPGEFTLAVTSYEEERLDSKALLEAIAKEYGEEKAKAFRAAAVKKSTKTLVDVKLREDAAAKKNGKR